MCVSLSKTQGACRHHLTRSVVLASADASSIEYEYAVCVSSQHFSKVSCWMPSSVYPPAFYPIPFPRTRPVNACVSPSGRLPNMRESIVNEHVHPCTHSHRSPPVVFADTSAAAWLSFDPSTGTLSGVPLVTSPTTVSLALYPQVCVRARLYVPSCASALVHARVCECVSARVSVRVCTPVHACLCVHPSLSLPPPLTLFILAVAFINRGVCCECARACICMCTRLCVYVCFPSPLGSSATSLRPSSFPPSAPSSCPPSPSLSACSRTPHRSSPSPRSHPLRIPLSLTLP